MSFDLNLRQRTLTKIIISISLLAILIVSGLIIDGGLLDINLSERNSGPSFAHPFGTDWLGRDMFIRTLEGLTLSLAVGLTAACLSTFIALILSLIASWNRLTDNIVTWLTDLFLSVPHIVILLLISFAAGGGMSGVMIGLALTHWPSLTRVLRAEMLQIKSAEYVSISRRLGKSRVWIARHHYLRHLMPQVLIGFILLFPHVILHEAAITFLGFGLSAEQPAIGIILSESMSYLSAGMWWLAFFPGLSLLGMVSLFNMLSQNIRRLMDPFDGQKFKGGGY